MSQKKLFYKLLFIFVGLFGIYGMVISGTRGALAVPIVGFMAYFVLSKNIKVLSVGFAFLIVRYWKGNAYRRLYIIPQGLAQLFTFLIKYKFIFLI